MTDQTSELAKENLTVDEVRDYFRLASVETVRRWHRLGKLRGFKVAGNVLLFRREDVLQYKAERFGDS